MELDSEVDVMVPARSRYRGLIRKRLSLSSDSQSPKVIPARTPGPKTISNRSAQVVLRGAVVTGA
jgi:hypothetical protein